MILALAGWLVGYILGRLSHLRGVSTLLLAAGIGITGLVVGVVEAIAFSGLDWGWLALAVLGPIAVWSARKLEARRAPPPDLAGANSNAVERRP